ncbi:hypothetical protein [Flavobacterium micromati]|uniref:hypothetical protein n=1 Tax=Flavobacterium micromati TaxID=229205 RepID=UPI0014800CB6|nr:hypothetical protein [Flavobacterium micromati]
MKTATTKKFSERNYFGPISIFISAIGLGYAFVNQYVYDKPNSEMLLMWSCLFLAGVFSVLRTKYSK